MTNHLQSRCRTAGFTMIELMVVVFVIGLLTAMVAPNLSMFVPEARIESAAKQLVQHIDFLRSEARISSKRATLELDLDNARWRYVRPAEEKLTTHQDVRTLETQYDEWVALDKDVKFLGAGNPIEGLARKKIFAITFDESGFASDQSIVLGLISEPNAVYTIRMRGLTGDCEIVDDWQGQEKLPTEVGEGAF